MAASAGLKGLQEDLKAIGVREGQCLEVHSSLRSIGPVEGGATTVVEALIGLLGPHGTLAMSAYPLSPPIPVTDEERDAGIDWEVRRLPDDSIERTGMGAVSDRFRNRPDVVLGTGIHRVCAWGRDAQVHASGYKHLADSDGHALLIGVDIDRCSSMHLAESTKITEKARALMDERWSPKSPASIKDGVRNRYPREIVLGSEGGWKNGDPWSSARDEAARKLLIRRGPIGNADSMFFKVIDLLSLIREVRREGPFTENAPLTLERQRGSC